MDPRDVINKGLLPGLNVIGEQFECEDIFLPELMQAALAFQAAMTVLEPAIKAAGGADEKKGTIVIGTVKGDLHSIGKNILKLLFETSGFEVHDLGIDVDLFKFINKANEVERRHHRHLGAAHHDAHRPEGRHRRAQGSGHARQVQGHRGRRRDHQGVGRHDRRRRLERQRLRCRRPGHQAGVVTGPRKPTAEPAS